MNVLCSFNLAGVSTVLLLHVGWVREYISNMLNGENSDFSIFRGIRDYKFQCYVKIVVAYIFFSS